MPNAVETLLAIEEIKRLKARYFRLMDTKDWHGFAELFTQDAIFDVRGALEENPGPDQEPIIGRSAIVEYVSSGIDPINSAHHGHMPEIDILSEDAASGIWALADILRMPSGTPFERFYGYGHYHESYRRIDGTWKIASLSISRLLVETY